MAIKKRGLGKGLNAVFGDSNFTDADGEGKISLSDINDNKPGQYSNDSNKNGEVLLKTSLIEPNLNQPRKKFNKEELAELAESINRYGVLQPIIVRKDKDRYKIIAGERRWRAAQAAGLAQIPAIIREYSNQEAMEISIIENIQRADLNPVEEARAYHSLLKEYGLKHEEIAARVSKNRATITNSLRLLKLDKTIQQFLIDGKLSQGQARALLAIEDSDLQKKAAEDIIKKGLNVREVEKLVKSLQKPKPEENTTLEDSRDYSIFYKEYEDKIRDILSTKVHINRKDKNKGRIEIEYYSSDELERIIELIKTIGK